MVLDPDLLLLDPNLLPLYPDLLPLDPAPAPPPLPSADKQSKLSGLSLHVASLSSSCDVTVLSSTQASTLPPGCSLAIVDDVTTVHMLLKGILDPALEIQKLAKKVKMYMWYISLQPLYVYVLYYVKP